MEKETSDFNPWWFYILLGFGIYLGGAIGAIATLFVLIGLWYLWEDSRSSFLKKSTLSLLIVIGGIVLYIAAIGLLFGGIAYFQEAPAKNITIKNPNYGFEITYPSTWHEETPHLENVVLYLQSNDGISAITIKRYDSGGITQEQSDQLLSDPEFLLEMENAPTISDIRASSIKINKRPHTADVYFEEINGVKYKILSTTIVISPTTALGINYNSANDLSFESNFNDASNIIDSIKFKFQLLH